MRPTLRRDASGTHFSQLLSLLRTDREYQIDKQEVRNLLYESGLAARDRSLGDAGRRCQKASVAMPSGNIRRLPPTRPLCALKGDL